MNKKSILSLLTVLWISMWCPPLSAQSFFDNDSQDIPGVETGYYCQDATLSTATVTLPGIVGENYALDSVSVSILHDNPEDLQLTLISPRGKILLLALGEGGSTDDAYANTVFSDLGSILSSSAPPFTGRFQAQGGLLNQIFAGDLATGDWQLEICDANGADNNSIVTSFGIHFTEVNPAMMNPVYEVDVSATTFINVNLDENCQDMLTYAQVLNGDYDADGDGNIPPNDAFTIVVNDDNPCNGPIIDGCGTFDYWISQPPMEPEILRGFMGCTGGDNILEFTVVPSPSTQSANVTVTMDTITMTTTANSAGTGTVEAGFSYVFPKSGQAGFRLNLSTSDAFDIVRINFDGSITNVTPSDLLGGTFTQAQPLAVETGDRLQFTLRNPTGPALSTPNTATAQVFDFFFQPTVPNIPVTNFLPLGGFVEATDATPVQFIDLPDAPDNLFTAQLTSVLTTSLPPNISRSYIVSGDGMGGANAILNNSLDPALAQILNLGGGLPIVFDGCADVQITVADQITSAGNCQDIVVTRTFIAMENTDCVSNEGPMGPITASYELIFRRPSLLDVNPPMAVVEVDCDEVTGVGNPAALAINFPTLSTINGDLFLNETIDNIGATFVDGPRINTCANTFKFVRTYTVIDWCDVDEVLTFNQLIKVGDFGAPMITAPTQDLNFDGIPDDGPLRFTTNAIGCTAFIDITSGVILDDDCSDVTTLVGFIFPDGDTDAIPFGPFDGFNIARDIPVGSHTLRYIANDICGNADTLDVDIVVADMTAPVAICEDGLNVSLGGSGTAILTGLELDAGSYDECAGNDLLYEIVRADANNNPIGPWSDEIVLTCTDIGVIRVGLRVTDDGNMNGIFEVGIDNSNICFTEVLVEDLGAPVCIAPSGFALTCSDLASNFPDDLDAAFAQDPDATINLLNDVFGTATGVDNCPGSSISQTVNDERTSCGTGFIRRNFGVTDAQGFTSFTNCSQTISVVGSFDYTIIFPADQSNMNCIEPDFNDVTIFEGNCNMLTMTTTIDTFMTSADACFLLRVTYEIIDLCEFGTGAAPYNVPRDADNDGVLGERVVLRVTPGNSPASISDDVAILDNDMVLSNGFINELDVDDGGLVPGANGAGYGQDPSRGAFIYQQFITVIDDTAPTVQIDESNSGGMDMNGSCSSDVDVQFSVTDECSMDAVTLVVDIDLFANDQNNDGSISAAEFFPNETVSVNDVLDIGEGDFRATLRDLPIGTHAVRVRASDGCGNTNPDIFTFDVLDATGPAISCINGLTATLSADEMGGGIASTTARSFVVDVDNVNDCSGTVRYSVYRVSDATMPGFSPNLADSMLVVTCDDLGMVPVRIYGFDPTGMTSFCETTLLVQVFDASICDPDPEPTPQGVIAGTIMTAAEEYKEGVEINIAAQLMGEFITYTSSSGTYIIEHLMEGDDFTIQPEFNPAIDLAKVSTGDLILMSQHILGLEEFNSPFQYVAADVNSDQRINVLDMIAIRRVILGITTDFGETNSWRFISADHNFNSLPENWLESNLMEVYNVNDLDGRMLSADFTAVAMGDVSGATAGGNLIEPATQRSDFALNTSSLQLEKDSYFEVPIYQPAELLGFQTTLQLLEGVELIDISYGTASEGDFNLDYVANGLIGIAHVSGTSHEEPLFTLSIKALVDGQLDDFIVLNDRLVTTESYSKEGGYPASAGLDLDFIEASEVGSSQLSVGLEVEQNYPNPFQRETRIDYLLPAETTVILRVQDSQGRLVLQRSANGMAGRNSMIIRREELKGSSGLLTYTIETDSATITRKMIVAP